MNSLLRLLVLGCFAVGCSAAPTEVAPPTELAHPPARPAASVAGGTRWFVIDSYRLGAADAPGVSGGVAWRRYGFDLDGRATSRQESIDDRGACLRPSGASRASAEDGERGIDNNFGQHFMGLMRSLMPDVERLTNERVAAGGYTLVLRVDDLGAGPDDAYAPGALYFVGQRGKAAFTPDETWPVVGTKLEPIATFDAGYVRDGVWVSGELGEGLPTVALPFLGDALMAPLYGGVFTLDLGTGEGVMAGAVRATEFLETMRPSLMRRGVCPGTETYRVYEQLVTSSADLLATVPLASDRARTCDAVSFGVGFTVKPIAGVEGVAGAPVPPTAECK